MKKKGINLHYIILTLILQVFSVAVPVSAISDAQKDVISGHCEAIRDNLKDTQRSDSRIMMDVGGYYEAILMNFVTPLNMRLVENNLLNTGLINNQNDFNQTRMDFVASYIEYQRKLEELILSDCKSEPEKFYDKLAEVRIKRKKVADGAVKLRKLTSEHMKLVKNLEASYD